MTDMLKLRKETLAKFNQLSSGITPEAPDRTLAYDTGTAPDASPGLRFV